MTDHKPTHPGAVFREDVMKPLNLSVDNAASLLGEDREDLSKFIHEEVPLSLELAIEIASATNITPECWMNMQTKLDLWEIYQTNAGAGVIPGCMTLASVGKAVSFTAENVCDQYS